MNDADLRDRLVATLAALIALPSTAPPGDTGAIMAYADTRLRESGYAVETVTRRLPVTNLVARLGHGRPVVAFNGHADTVGPGDPASWQSDPFAGTIIGDRLHGLGAVNCKGALAVHLCLAEEIARRGGPQRGTVAFAFVGDEEALGPDGTAHLRESGRLRPDTLIVGAPTGNRLITEERGVLWARVQAFGRAAHAGLPHQGDNAILRMLRLVAALERDLAPVLARRAQGGMQATINIGTIAGGSTANVVPGGCTIEIDRRLLPNKTVTGAFAAITAALGAAGEPAGSWNAELLTGTNGFGAKRDSGVVAAFVAAYKGRRGVEPDFVIPVGASDARYFADDGIEILVTGPGDDREGHAANESIAIVELVDALHIHRAAIGMLLGFAR